MSENEEEPSKKMKEDNLSKEEAEKKVAKTELEEKTGVNAEALAEFSKEVLKMKDGIEAPDLELIKKGLESIDSPALNDLLEKMKDGQVAENIVKAGLGSEHVSTDKGGLMDGAKVVQEKSREYSKESQIGDDLEDASNYGEGPQNKKNSEKTKDEKDENEAKDKEESSKESEVERNLFLLKKKEKSR